jgi:hypothetical protein
VGYVRFREETLELNVDINDSDIATECADTLHGGRFNTAGNFVLLCSTFQGVE